MSATGRLRIWPPAEFEYDSFKSPLTGGFLMEFIDGVTIAGGQLEVPGVGGLSHHFFEFENESLFLLGGK